MPRLSVLGLALAALNCVAAFNYVFEGCDQDMADVPADYITKVIDDARDLAREAYRNFPPRVPFHHEDPNELKAFQPLIPDLFGSITEDEWVTIDIILDWGDRLAQDRPSDGKDKLFLLTCLAPGTVPKINEACFDDPLMTTLPNEGGSKAEHKIVICPDFWRHLKREENPVYRRTRSEHAAGSDFDVCMLKPLDLGDAFAARLIYHELFHILAQIKSPLADLEFMDRQTYSVDEDHEHKPVFLITQWEHTFYSKQSPDALSFWGIMSWRQKICAYHPFWTADTRTPLVTVKTYPDERKPGLYGPVNHCPGANRNLHNPVVTKPVIDTRRNARGGMQDFTWCKLIVQTDANGCRLNGWVRQKITVLSALATRVFDDHDTEVQKEAKRWTKLYGCFPALPAPQSVSSGSASSVAAVDHAQLFLGERDALL